MMVKLVECVRKMALCCEPVIRRELGEIGPDHPTMKLAGWEADRPATGSHSTGRERVRSRLGYELHCG